MPAEREDVRFFYVWTKKGNPPRFAHSTEVGACDEAIRLAEANPGRKYIVLKAVHKFLAAPPCPAVA